ncbi:hypothetical protein HNQ07_003644 [Deinococcus metalli]|uniref:Uncharacterized protein n=1 Tax=Deinococcus metalli TaxID=1141878 RepID=A0A7W8KJ66_9DEIO|nr:hypothetical protein [Deinococcus metalli]
MQTLGYPDLGKPVIHDLRRLVPATLPFTP